MASRSAMQKGFLLRFSGLQAAPPQAARSCRFCNMCRVHFFLLRMRILHGHLPASFAFAGRSPFISTPKFSCRSMTLACYFRSCALLKASCDSKTHIPLRKAAKSLKIINLKFSVGWRVIIEFQKAQIYQRFDLCDNYSFLRSYWSLLYMVRNKPFYMKAQKQRKLHIFNSPQMSRSHMYSVGETTLYIVTLVFGYYLYISTISYCIYGSGRYHSIWK